MKEAIKLEDGGEIVYDPAKDSIKVDYSGSESAEFSSEAFEEIVKRMKEMGWIGEEKSRQILHG